MLFLSKPMLGNLYTQHNDVQNNDAKHDNQNIRRSAQLYQMLRDIQCFV
jgi:hypothetical protein